MIADHNIICIASNWFYDPTSKHHIMKRLSERNHIIWVNYHGSRRPTATAADLGAIAGKLRQVVQGPRQVSDHMTVVTPMVLPWPGSSTARQLNQVLLVRQINRVLRRLPPRPVQLWTFAPDVDYLCGRFGESAVVYYCVDEFSAFEGYDRDAILTAERRLCEQADITIATSQALLDSKSGWSRRTALVTHGVDYHHFALATTDTLQEPDDIRQLPHPRMGFWGLIQSWFDVELVAHMARQRPNWSIVLVGETATEVGALRELPNVRLLGRRSYEQLPAYAAAFDIGIIPFRVNTLTHAVNPIKLREYLSAGLPVASTPMPEVARYGDFVETGAGPDGFIRACERALERNSQAERAHRQQAMERETWRAKVEEISRLVEDATGSRMGLTSSNVANATG